MKVGFFNSYLSSSPTQSLSSTAGNDVGSSSYEIQIGRSGDQPFNYTFWTDGPAISSSGFMGTA